MSRSEHTGIAVIESRWWDDKNISVRGLFDLVSDISCGTPHGYHYEMVGSEYAVKEAIPRIAANRKCKVLCLATHANDDGLELHNRDRLSRAELRNLLIKIEDQDGSVLNGLYLSSCMMGTEKLANFIFAKKVCLSWIAGYDKEVDFVDSAALDLLFFREWSKTHRLDSPNKRIQQVAERLQQTVGGLMTELGFGIYSRKQGAERGAKNLVFGKLEIA